MDTHGKEVLGASAGRGSSRDRGGGGRRSSWGGGGGGRRGGGCSSGLDE